MPFLIDSVLPSIWLSNKSQETLNISEGIDDTILICNIEVKYFTSKDHFEGINILGTNLLSAS